MGSVFISYRSTDRAFVLHLAEALKQNGQDVWLDQWRITGRDPYWDEIQHGIETSRYFIFVISPDSVSKATNNGARKELYHAAGLPNGPIIVPVIARETPYTDLPIVITPGMYQIHDFVHVPFDRELLNVLTVLNADSTAKTAISKKLTSILSESSPQKFAENPIRQRPALSRLPIYAGVIIGVLVLAVIGFKVIGNPNAQSSPDNTAVPPTTPPVTFSGPKLAFFNGRNGSNTLVTGLVDNNGQFFQLPKAGDSNSAVWTKSAGTTSCLLVFYSFNAESSSPTYEVGRIADDGTYTVLQNGGLRTNFTDLVGLANQMVLFYKRDSSMCAIERVQDDGTLNEGYTGPCAVQTPNADLIAATQDGKSVLFYSPSSQQVTVVTVNSDGSGFSDQGVSTIASQDRWNIVTDVGHNRVLFYAANGDWATFQIAAGALTPLANNKFSPGWSHILYTNNQVMFYNTANASVIIGVFGDDGQLKAGPVQSLIPGWMLITSTQ